MRLRGYDYARGGAYFVTLCTAQREAMLATIRDGDVVLTEAGAIVQAQWEALPDRFANVALDACVIMPDHLHAIVLLHGDGLARTPLSGILRAFKPITGIEVNRRRGTPGAAVWQPRFFDRVIRDEVEMERARRYIADNPARWHEVNDDTGAYG